MLRFFRDLPEDGCGHDGVLCQEVLRVLLDRVHCLHVQDPCHENVEVVRHLRGALVQFEQRAARRTLEKSYRRTGLHVEELSVRGNGHVFDLGSPEGDAARALVDTVLDTRLSTGQDSAHTPLEQEDSDD